MARTTDVWIASGVRTPFAKVDGMFNFDMTGEGDGAGGAASAEGLQAAILEADKHVLMP